ncbi:hypothetical protein [Caldivirga sp. UBA161]|uniref:hypothetical protein n=1 Tax=Caldivirga sp. UBA161 TaxID=1915569 RepID=UPI0025BA3E8A|nr:hypothetical protein [Caldivirga sp. UBA161]
MAIEASYSKVNITPPIGLRLGGYAHRVGKPSIMVHDELYARLLMISSGEVEVIVVQLDLLGLYSNDASLIRRSVSKVTGVKEDNIMVASTHTHSAPETIIPMWPNTLPYSEEEKAKYNDWFTGVVSKLTEAAGGLNGTERVELRIGVGEANGLCFNRSFKGGLVSGELPILLVKFSKGKVALVNYPCHPVCNTDLGFSADYPGVTYESLLSNGVELMFLTGAAGDIDPIRKGRGYMSYLGYSLSSSVIETLGSLKPTAPVIRVKEIKITLPLRTINQEEARLRYEEALRRVKAKGGLPNEPSESIWVNEDYLTLMYSDEEYEVSKDNRRFIEAEVNLLRIGGLLMVTIPGEAFIESALMISSIAEGMGFKETMVVGYVNDYVGYIPIKASFIKGTYEAKLARWSRVTDDAEGLIIKGIESNLREIAP